ncbi:MAG: HEAT repeat domain-containing protein, partial [bacterium]|nr:HEAT repeat domain-containing protein [bacterium]
MIFNNKSSFKILFFPFLLAFLLDSMFVLNYTYADALFLSTYPPAWLLYYYIADPFFTVFIFFISSHFLSQCTTKQSFFFVLGSIPLLCAAYALTNLFYVVPFVLSLMLYSFTKLIFTIGWSAIAMAFNVGLFKKHAFQLSVMGVIASILTALLIPFVIHFSSSKSVFYGGVIVISLIAFCVLKLEPLETAPQLKASEPLENNLFKNSFFRSLFFFTIIAMAVIALAEFSFQQQLMGSYSRDNLATFISIFSGAITSIGFILQMFFAKRILTWIGLTGIMLILPIACLFLGVGIAIWPMFAFFILFNGMQRLLTDSFMMPCREIMLNPFPSTLRKKANMLIRGQAAPIGGLLGAGLIFLVQHLNINMLGLLVALLSAPWIYFTFRACKGYQNILHTSLKENRYNTELLNLTDDTAILMREEILNALKNPNVNSIKTGLAFFEQDSFVQMLNDTEIQTAITQIISHPEANVRLMAVDVLKKLNASAAIKIVMTQLEQETDNDVGWAIISFLFALNYFSTITAPREFIRDTQSFIQAFSLLLLHYSTNNNDKHRAQAIMEQL